MRSAEYAGAVCEPAVGIIEFRDPVRCAIQNAHTRNDLADILSVGAHVLHRRAAHSAWNPAETFDPRKISICAILHERIPLDSRSDRKPAVAFIVRRLNAFNLNFDNQPRVAGIGDNEVAPAAHYKGRTILCPREFHPVLNLVLSLRPGKKTGRSPDAKVV